MEIGIGRESAGRRREVLRVLRASGEPMSIVAIADALGVHPNTVRFHLDGCRRRPGGAGRAGPQRARAAAADVPGGPADGSRRYATLPDAGRDPARAIAAEGIRAIRRWPRGGRGAPDGIAAGRAPEPRGRSSAWSRCSTGSASRPSAGTARRAADRPAALPVSGIRRRPRQHRVSRPPWADAGRPGNLGGARHRRAARARSTNRTCAWRTSE